MAYFILPTCLFEIIVPVNNEKSVDIVTKSNYSVMHVNNYNSINFKLLSYIFYKDVKSIQNEFFILNVLRKLNDNNTL
jgi:hypothetical protein